MQGKEAAHHAAEVAGSAAANAADSFKQITSAAATEVSFAVGAAETLHITMGTTAASMPAQRDAILHGRSPCYGWQHPITLPVTVQLVRLQISAPEMLYRS